MQEKNMETQNVALVLENGVCITAQAYNVTETVCAELVFNTSMFGYQEIITDDSYTGQAIVFTMPHIGAVGCNSNDMESPSTSPTFIVVRTLEEYPSSYRATESLQHFLQRNNVPVLFNIDTRYLTTMIRNAGALRAMVVPLEGTKCTKEQQQVWHTALQQYTPLEASTMCKGVQEITEWKQGIFSLPNNNYTEPTNTKYTVAIYDFGIKYNIARILTSLGARCLLVPQHTPIEDVLALVPDGICFSNGPGNPEDYTHAIAVAKMLYSKNIPLLGICLGHQILALALGASTVKMPFGHHGSNHPVQDTITKKVSITSQNHGFAVDTTTLPKNVQQTYVSLFDGSSQGMYVEHPPTITFQGHPEASPGPRDIECLFSAYMTLVQAYNTTNT